MKIIDAHSHLWLRQDTVVDGQRISPLPDGKAMFFGEERQMLPPFMIDGRNSAEVFLSNMNYARVSAAIVVQEVIDGNQNEYLSIRIHPPCVPYARPRIWLGWKSLCGVLTIPARYARSLTKCHMTSS